MKYRDTISPAIVQHNNLNYNSIIYLPLVVMGVYLLAICYKYIVKHGCKSHTSTLIPKKANRLRELLWTISSQNEKSDSSEEEFTHDRLMDEDVDNIECRQLENTQLGVHRF